MENREEAREYEWESVRDEFESVTSRRLHVFTGWVLRHWASPSLVDTSWRQVRQQYMLLSKRQLLVAHDTVSKRLRRWTRNPLGSARRGSNPLGVVCNLSGHCIPKPLLRRGAFRGVEPCALHAWSENHATSAPAAAATCANSRCH